MPPSIPLNKSALEFIESNVDSCDERLEEFQIKSHELACGTKVLDFGTQHPGHPTSGLWLATICMADLANIETIDGPTFAAATVSVKTEHPLEACMASQYAGWPLSVGDYFAMCSGPARSLRGKEKVLQEYDLFNQEGNAVAVLETSKLPGEDVARAIAEECSVAPERVTLCVASTSSHPGTMQVTARCVETAIHKLHELGFNLRAIKSGIGQAPLPPQADNDLLALGWTNDAMLYGADVELSVNCDDEAIESIGPKIPSSSSPDFGKPFIEIFERYERDFYKIDPMLFSPAKITIRNVKTGNEFSWGEIREDILKASWNQ